MVFLLDFLVFELGDSLVVLSVADSLLGDFSVFASDFSDFFELLFSALLFFSLELLLLDGLDALSAAGLLAVEDFVDFAGEGEVAAGESEAIGLAFAVALVVGVVVAAGAGVIVAPTLAVAAGVALALVEAAVLVVVPVVVPVVVVPVVVEALTPKVVGTLTP